MEDQNAPRRVTDELLASWSIMANAEEPHQQLGRVNWVMIVRSLIAEIMRLRAT